MFCAAARLSIVGMSALVQRCYCTAIRVKLWEIIGGGCGGLPILLSSGSRKVSVLSADLGIYKTFTIEKLFQSLKFLSKITL